MDPTASAALEQFFGAYLHQDWPLDAPDWQSAVRSFLAEASSQDVARVSAGIRELLHAGHAEEQLSSIVLDRFRCYYLPTADGTSFHGWLRAVLDLFEEAQGQAGSPAGA